MAKTKKPILLILVGPPGSGKTYLAERLFRNKGFMHINSDGIRAQYFKNPQFTAEERAQVYLKIKETITDNLESGSNVIFDGNLLTNADRKEAMDYYGGKIMAEVLFICLNIPKEVAINQAITRKSSEDNLYNEMPIERAIKMHETFQAIEPTIPHITISNLEDTEEVESLVKRKLKF